MNNDSIRNVLTYNHLQLVLRNIVLVDLYQDLEVPEVIKKIKYTKTI